MNKLKLLTLAGCMISGMAYSQQFYFRTGLGYAIAQASQSIDGSGQPYNGTVNAATQQASIKGASFSAGLQAQVGIGYMINDHLGIQVDANLGVSNRKYTLSVSNVTLGGGVPGSVQYVQQANSPVVVLPAIVVQSGGEQVNAYSRFGVALPLRTEITVDEIQTNDPNTGALTVDDFTFKTTNKFSLGFAGAIGVQYKLNNRVSIWGEMSMLSMSVYIKKSQLTSVTENGYNVPLSAVVGNQTVNYSKNPPADSTGANLPTYSQPFSNVAFNFGISIRLGSSHRGHDVGEGRKSRRPGPARFR